MNSMLISIVFGLSERVPRQRQSARSQSRSLKLEGARLLNDLINPWIPAGKLESGTSLVGIRNRCCTAENLSLIAVAP